MPSGSVREGDGCEGDEMGREVDELKWVEGVMRSPEYNSSMIFTQTL